MSNTFTIQKLVDGPRNAIFKVDISLDGSGDYTIPEIIIQVKTLSIFNKPGLVLPPKPLRVDDLDWDVQQGLAVNLWWDGAGPASIWRMVGRSREKAFRYGGLQNNADQPNGNITFTTTSPTTGVPMSAAFTISCVKRP